ncbi:MAG: phosphatidylserine decarboxylase family protein [Bacteroidales bacterium]|nr:phosphatidylserine decarboxylase family protein [Bacteroidales bacterium]
MKLHKEGRTVIIIAFLALLALAFISWYIPVQFIFKVTIISPLFILFLLIIWFFRVPGRKCDQIENLVYAPADGKIVVIEKTEEKEYFKDERIQISIFMSPLNVHQNVYPVGGTVSYIKYHKGNYLVAWHPKSSTENERCTIVIRKDDGTEILVKQIAGAVARRICTYSKVNDIAPAGRELGFIKFGSRVDVFLPVNAKITCKVGQKSVGRLTVLAEL